MKTLFALFALVPAVVAVAAQVTEVKVKALDGFGGDTGSVMSRCQTKAGAEYDPVAVTRDVTSLTSSGEFEDVAVDANEGPDGVEVVFYVKRKVRYLQPLVVEGNDFFSESKVSKEAALKDGFLYGEADLAEAAAKVRKAYQKKYFADAKVTPKVTLLSGNDATITFLIDEGARRKVRSVVFTGADHAVDSSALNRATNPFYALGDGEFEVAELREAVSDYPWWNPIGWFADNPVTRDQRAQCCSKLEEVYRNHGYLDARVTGPESVATDDGARVDLVFTVEEGPRYRIGEMAIAGLTRYTEDDVAAQSDLPEIGDIASQKVIDEAAHRIKVAVGSGDSGLADTRVEVRPIPNVNDPTTVDLVFQVTEGVPVVIDEIKIRGNDYTKDKVIRREITLGPGDRMLEDRAERSQKKLENLDYFSRVRYYLEPANKGQDSTGAEYRNLVYEVEEKSTGSFMVGVGASSVDSVYVSAEINQYNFDLFAPSKLFRGGGQKGRAYVAWGPRYQSAELGVTEPWFMDRMLELSVDAYRRLRWYDQYDLIRSGANASISYPVKFWPSWEAFGRLGVGISGEFIEMDDVDKTMYDIKGEAVSAYKREARKYGDAFEPVLHLFWAKDERDNFRIPTRGYRARVFGDLAPFGDNTYWRLGANYRHYWTVWKRYNHVLMANFRAETIDAFSDDVPIYNRMFLGGPRSIRGLEYRTVSPKIRRYERNSWDPWGGQTLFCANFEYTIPVVKMFRFAMFTDLGSVGEDVFDFDFSDNFAWTIGLGLRLDIPMFPIRLDFAAPVVEPKHAEKEVFSFSVGYDF